MNRKFLALSALLLAALACTLLPGSGTAPPPPATVDDVATIVALTLTAEGGALPTLEPTATETPPPAPLRVAYVSDGNLWLWTDGAGAAMLHDDPLEVGDMRLSDDGQVVAFTLLDSFDVVAVWAIDTDGSNLRQLLDSATLDSMITNPDAVSLSPYRWEFIPGTHILAFNTTLFFEGPGLGTQDDLRLVDADSLALSTLLSPGDAGQFYYSPDGTQIALVTPTDVSLINADGGNRRDGVLVYPSIITYSEYAWYATPLWAPDGSYLRVLVPTPDILADDASFTVYHIPVDGSPATAMSTFLAIPPVPNVNNPLAPNLSQVAFRRRVGDPTANNFELHIANVDGTGDTTYVTDNLQFIAWAQDSLHFSYEIGGHSFVGQIGASVIPLPDTGVGVETTWVDGTHVLYLSGGGGSWELRLFDLTTATSSLVASITAQSPTFTFDN